MIKKLLAAVTLILLPWIAIAQTFPDRPVRIVLSIGAGAGPDVMARKIAEVLSERWGQPTLVVNKPGGAGVIGINYINGEPADGYTIGLLDGGTVVSYAALYRNSDPISKLEPLVPVLDANMALFVSSSMTNLQDLRQELAANPAYSSWNIGSIAHILGAEFSSALSKNTSHVPYRDFGTWQADVASRRVAFAFGSTGTIKSMVQAGRVRMLAVAANQRDPRYPNIPTIREITGQNINTMIAWCAFYVPATVPKSVKSKLEHDIREALLDSRVQETMSKFDYISLHTMSLASFQQKVRQDQDRYSEIINRFNITVQ